ncbi:MAG: 50S ribosome-binding protein YggL [Gemmatimonadaceae bacterium]
MSAPCPMLGFMFTARFDDSVAEADADRFIDELIRLLEANGLMAGGGGDRTIEFAINREGGPATDADREMILQWASQRRHVAAVEMSDLVDLNEIR